MYKISVLLICVIMFASCVSQPTDDTVGTAVKKEIIEVGDSNVLEVELENYENQSTFPPFSVIEDPEASGGKAIVWLEKDGVDEHVPDPWDDTAGQVAISFSIAKAAETILKIQVNMPNADDDSLYYKMDSGKWGLQNNTTTVGYDIIEIYEVFNLEAGEHTLKILRRENGSILDKVILEFSYK